MSVGFPPDLHPALSPILETVLDAVIVMAEDGRITAWNGVAEQTFGWSAREAVGQLLADVVIPPIYRTAHEEGLRRLNGGGEARVLDRRIEIAALCKDGREIPVELSITRTAGPHQDSYIGFLRDISDRRNAEDQLRRQALETRTMFEIAEMAAEADSLDAALEKVINAICTITGWPVGHAFLVQDDDEKLVSTSIWGELVEGASRDLRVATEAASFATGIGLPGRIQQSGEPLWITDVEEDDNFIRRGHGYRGAFGFPLRYEGKTIAILEFFAKDVTPPDADLLLRVRALGEQVGRVFERKRTEDRQRLLLNELRHRVKNILAVVQAVAHQTFRDAQDPRQAYEAFSSRLKALAEAQNLLVAGNWRSAPLRNVIDAALNGCGGSQERFKISGPPVDISASSAVSITLAVHELCTNAFKYGALSAQGGSVEISWGVESGPRGPHYFFEWRESGGPPVCEPTRKGFGTSLLERGLARDLGGEVQLTYAPDGLVCRFTSETAVS